MTKPMTHEEWAWDMFCGPDEPPVYPPEPDVEDIDYEEIAIEIWGHWPGPLDAQQQHDLLMEARARGLI